MSFVIRLKKENFKFSCSHFTIFSATKAERLHGHNYYLGLSCKVTEVSKDLGFAFDFNELKPLVKNICDSLDETILIPKDSPYLNVKSQGLSVRVTFGKKEYVFPKEDVTLLPLVNITTEELSRYVANMIAQQMKQKELPVTELAVTVKETQGQSVTFTKKV